MDNYREYIIQVDGYGVLRFRPVFIANIIVTKLEQWLQDNKFIYLAFQEFNGEKYLSQNLQTEFVYSSRVEPTREAAEIRRDVLNQINAKQYQLLIEIVRQSFEMIYECYELFDAPKIGQNIIDFKNEIQRKVAIFEEMSFPDKANIIRKLGKSEELIQFVEEMDAVRNCIEHRSGIVDKKQDLKGKTKLSIHWRAPSKQVSVTTDITERFNSKLSLDHGVFEFREGRLITFSSEDNYKLSYTIMHTLKTIIDGLYEKFGIAQYPTEEILKEFRD